MKGWRQKSAVIAVSVMIFLTIFSPAALAAERETGHTSTVTTDTYNVMLLIDQSGSMNRTDQGRLALSAACQFVDQLCMTFNGLAATTNVGAMSFSQTTELVCELRNLELEANTDYLKASINQITYQTPGTGGTDLGTAVYDAADFLQKQTLAGERNMIVLFTDGYTDNALDPDESMERLEKAFQIAGELKSEIYIVGLNHEGTIKEEGRKEIYRIADTAQIGDGVAAADEEDPYAGNQKVNYLITDSIGRVREFYGRIYARMFGSGMEFVDHHQFVISPDGVAAAAVTVYSEETILDVSLTDPSGRERNEDGENIAVSGDDFYKVIKLTEPEVGTWTVTVRTDDESYQTYVIRLYGIEISIGSTWGEKGKDGFEHTGLDASYIGRVSVEPVYDGRVYKNSSFIESISTAECIIRDKDKGQEKVCKLSYEEESGKFLGFFPVQEGVYELEAVLANDSFSRRVTDTLNVKLQGQKDSEKNVQDGEENPDVPNPSGDDINDDPGSPWPLLLLFLLLLFAVFVLLRQRRYIAGAFEIRAEKADTLERLEYTVSSYPRGSQFSLWKLTERIIKNCRAQGGNLSGEEEIVCGALEKEKRGIAKKKLVVCRLKSSRGTENTYKLDNGGGRLLDLKNPKLCYGSEATDLRITISFRPLRDSLDD